jgi:hypothetical protein
VPEDNQPNGYSDKPNSVENNPFYAAYSVFKRLPIGLRNIVGGAFLCLIVVVVIAVFHPSLNERWKFGTDMGLNVLILLVIAVQTYIYIGQWDAMAEGLKIERDKTDPRLRVAEVTAEHFEVGKRPFFVVTMANDGSLAATDVRIHMSIQINDETPMNWINDVVVTIPANGKRHDFIHSSSWLSQEQIESFESSKTSLKVVGFFDYAPVGLTTFCYKYVPLQGEERPPKIPQFVPCDYTPRLNTTLYTQSIKSQEAFGIPTIRTAKAREGVTPNEIKPDEKEQDPKKDAPQR